MRAFVRLCVCSVALIAAGCTTANHQGAFGNSTLVPSVRPPDRARRDSSQYIKHVVIIVQENRSFDNIFAGFPNADAPTYGYKHNGALQNLKQIGFTKGVGVDIGHSYGQALTEYDFGKMDGFDEDVFNNKQPARNYPYAFVNRTQVKPYWDMASQYVLADHMFPTVWGPSFTAHLDLIAGTTVVSDTSGTVVSEIDTPYNQQYPNWNCSAQPQPPTYILTYKNGQKTWSGGGPPPCFTQFRTMADTLDAANVSWKYYSPAIGTGSGQLWSAFGAIQNVYTGPDWTKDVISPESTVLTDVPNGTLPSVSWVIPDNTNSDHDGNGSDTGPSWVAAVVNTIGASQYWDSTAIVVVWDDWGGWYDDVPPPQLDFMGLGIRVGCIIVSPYAKAGSVVHTQYEFGSILKFIEDTFGVPSLGYTDARASSLADSFDFTQHPLKFRKIRAKYPASYFLGQRPSRTLPDDE